MISARSMVGSAASDAVRGQERRVRTDPEIDWASSSCSAWENRSMAIQSGSVWPSQTTRISRTGDHVDADLAEHVTLGGGHVDVAGADDLVHRGTLSVP